MRTVLQSYLPSPESARAHRALRWLGPLLDRPWLWHLNRRSVALGAAIGLFFGLLVPVAQILFAGAAAVVMRANLPVAVMSTLITNPFTVAPLYLLAYWLGAYVVGDPDAVSRPVPLDGSVPSAHSHLANWLAWLGEIGGPLVAGLSILAVVGAAAGYFGVHLAWKFAVLLRLRRRATREASYPGSAQ